MTRGCLQAGFSLDLKPSSNVRINVSPNYIRLFDTEQLARTVVDPLAASTYGRRYAIAALSQSTLTLETRLDFTISPTLSFVLYMQPFVSSGHYDDYKWDYRPGSALYFVWQQQRSDFASLGEFEARRDVGAIFRTVPTNVFPLKATYWIGK